MKTDTDVLGKRYTSQVIVGGGGREKREGGEAASQLGLMLLRSVSKNYIKDRILGCLDLLDCLTCARCKLWNKQGHRYSTPQLRDVYSFLKFY